MTGPEATAKPNSHAFADLSTCRWWMDSAPYFGWNAPGVSMVCTGGASCVAPAVAWFATASIFMTEESKPAFSDLGIFVPAGTQPGSYSARFRATVDDALGRMNAEFRAAFERHWKDGRAVRTGTDSHRLIAEIEALQERSAICVCAASRMRFHDLEVHLPEPVRTHTGGAIRHTTPEDLAYPHLFALLDQLMAVALKRKIAVVVFEEEFAVELEKLPEHLRTHPQFALNSVSDGDEQKNHNRTVFEAVRLARNNDLAGALQYLDAHLTEDYALAHAKSQALGAAGRWYESWLAVQPFVPQLTGRRDPNVTLSLASTASSCGQFDEAEQLLMHALSLPLVMVEQLNAAVLVAKDVGSSPLLNAIIDQLRRDYPNHPITVRWSYERLMTESQYSQAAELARSANLAFELAWAEQKAAAAPDWNSFVEQFRGTEHQDHALQIAIINSLESGAYEVAEAFVATISPEGPSQRFHARQLIRLIAKGLALWSGDSAFDKLTAHFAEIVSYIASHPEDKETRDRLLTELEGGSDEGSVLMLLIKQCSDAFILAAPKFQPPHVMHETMSFEDVEPDSPAALDFFRHVGEKNNKSYFGKATIPDAYSNGVSDEALSGLTVLVQALTVNADTASIGLLLQTLNVAVKLRGYETWDYQGALQLGAALTLKGDVSHALGLAESILLFWPASVEAHREARVAHAWSCLADVYQRSRQFPAALLHLAVMFAAVAKVNAKQDAILLKHKLRLAVRLFRDLKAPFFEQLLDLELQLARQFPTLDSEERQILVTQLSCQLQYFSDESSDEDLARFTEATALLLSDDDEMEWAPLIAVASRVLDLYYARGSQPPSDFETLVLRRAGQCHPWLQRWFRKLLLRRVQVEDIEEGVRSLTDHNHGDDQGYFLSQMDRLLKLAIKNACDSEDAELFCRAATLLSQPALSASRATQDGDAPQRAAIPPVGSLFGTAAGDVEGRLTDYAHATSRQVEAKRSLFHNLSALPAASVRFLAGDDERIVFLAHDIDGRLCTLDVTREVVSGPTKLPIESWNSRNLARWRSAFPHGYSWDKSSDDLGEVEIPKLDKVKESFAQLDPGLAAGKRFITVLPEAELFGFTYHLGMESKLDVPSGSVVSVAPSLAWLTAVRSNPVSPRFGVAAWLGNPATSDWGILRLKSELSPIVVAAGGTRVDASTPRSLERSPVAIVLAHGSRGNFGGFSTVQDGVRFTPEELADWLGESACVVFLVCHAGKSTPRTFSNETMGLISRLLERKVRAIVAPPAPLNRDLVALWLEPFLVALKDGATVGDAHQLGFAEVRRRHPHVCAWTSLQIFGDSQLCFAA